MVEVSTKVPKKCFFILILTLIVDISLTAQTQIAVPLGDPVYYVLEQAQMRGLCANLPNAGFSSNFWRILVRGNWGST